MSLKKFLVSWVSELWIYILTLHLYLHFILNLHLWIRIHKAPEYGSNMDPDPQHCSGCVLP